MRQEIRFEMRGAGAMGCYWLLANWAGEKMPTLDATSKPMSISFEVDSPDVIDAIRSTLGRAEVEGGEVALGARALMKVLDGNAGILG